MQRVKLLQMLRLEKGASVFMSLTQAVQYVKHAGVACPIRNKTPVPEGCLVMKEILRVVFKDEAFSLVQENGLRINFTALVGKIGT